MSLIQLTEDTVKALIHLAKNGAEKTLFELKSLEDSIFGNKTPEAPSTPATPVETPVADSTTNPQS